MFTQSSPEFTRLLLVEDHAADAALVQDLLAEGAQGPYRVTHVTRLSEALERSEAAAFDLALLDLGLPDAQGLDTVNRFLESATTFPTVVLTGQDAQAVGKEAIRLGVQDFLPKDELSPNMLVRVIQYALQRFQTASRLRVLAAAFESGQAVVIAGADRRVQEVNSAFTRITGYASADVAGERVPWLDPDHHGPDFERALLGKLAETGHWEGEIWSRRQSGEAFPMWQSIKSVCDERGGVEYYVSVFHDISQQKALERSLEAMATYDPLTGIYNRSKLYTVLDGIREEQDRYGYPFAVIMFDIDHFKAINDTYGHAQGDEVLRQLADRVQEAIRVTDHFGRWGGEEFLIVAPHTTEEGVAQLAERVWAAVRAAEFPTVGRVTLSLGTAVARQGEPIEHLEERADQAMYRAKQQGRDRIAPG